MTPPCGATATNATYHQHYRRGEVPCADCRAAHSRNDRERREISDPRHGTWQGVALHRRAKTPVCQPCLYLVTHTEHQNALAYLWGAA